MSNNGIKMWPQMMREDEKNDLSLRMLKLPGYFKPGYGCNSAFVTGSNFELKVNVAFIIAK